MKRFMMAAGLAVVLTGCKMDVTPEVYVSDLRAVAVDGESGLSTPAAFTVKVGSMSTCQERAERFEAILRDVVLEFSSRGCEGTGNDVRLAASIQIPVVNTLDAWMGAKSLFGVMSHLEEGSLDAIGVFFLADPGRFAQLNGEIKSEFYQGIDLADSRVKVVLSNDERTEARFTVNDVYFNGQPIQGLNRTEHALARRRDAEIVLSNVALDALVQGQPVPTLVLTHP